MYSPEADLPTPCMTRWRPPEDTITEEEEDEEEGFFSEEEEEEEDSGGVEGSIRRPCETKVDGEIQLETHR